LPLSPTARALFSCSFDWLCDEKKLFSSSSRLETNDNHFIRFETYVRSATKTARKKDTKRYFSSHRNNNNVAQYDGSMGGDCVRQKDGRREGGGRVRPRDVDGATRKRRKTDELLLLKQIFLIYFECSLAGSSPPCAGALSFINFNFMSGDEIVMIIHLIHGARNNRKKGAQRAKADESDTGAMFTF
jgi:hypothetical protein